MNHHTIQACREELTGIVKEGKGDLGKALKKLVGTAEQVHPTSIPSLSGSANTLRSGAAGHVAPTIMDTIHAAPESLHAAVGAPVEKPGVLRRIGEHLHKYEDPYEVAGLGVLGGIGADRLQAHARAGAGAPEEAIEHKQLMGETGHAAADTLGLGILAAPLVAKRAITGKWTGH